MHFNIGTNPNVVFKQLYNSVSNSLQKRMIVKFWAVFIPMYNNVYFLPFFIHTCINVYTKYIWVVFGSCYQWARKPQNYPITASYIGGLTPK